MFVRLTDSPIDPERLLATVASRAHGATALFLGTVRDRNDGRAVTGIDYSAYAPMAVRELERIAAEASAGFGVAVAVEHRVGTLRLGEASVAVATAHTRRAPALAALGYVVEELKRRVPIWKREHYADGSRAWVAATTSPDVDSAPPPAGAGLVTGPST
jgi:molybdopterin synthase catalytic subunit